MEGKTVASTGTPRDTIPEILSRAGIFQEVDPETLNTLIEQLTVVDFKRGDTVFQEGEPGDCLYIIISGKAKLVRRSNSVIDNRENLLGVMGPSDMFGELSIFDPGPRTSSAICVTDLTAATMDSKVLHRWINTRPEVSSHLLCLLARRLRATNASLADLIFTPVPGRVAKALLNLANRFGVPERNTIRVNHDLTQEEIAQLVGASREAVNKALAEFQSRGWIHLGPGRSLLILNTPKLVARATD